MRCIRCFRPSFLCPCSSIKSFATSAQLCLLMHPKEAKKQRIGTGRLTKLIIPQTQIYIDSYFQDNNQVNRLLSSNEYLPVVLYPHIKSLNISKSDFPVETRNILISGQKKLLIFIIDATWPLAKSIINKSPQIKNLPFISFDILNTSDFKIKKQPKPQCLSTIESVYQLLHWLEQRQYEDKNLPKHELLDQFNKLVEFQINCQKRFNHPARGIRMPLSARG